MKNLIFISLLFLFSCAKDGKNIYVEGRVVNPETGEGISNITLDLRKQVASFGSGQTSKTVRSVITNQNGDFVIAHNGSLFNNYIVHMSDSNGKGYHVKGWKDNNGNSIGNYNLDVNKGDVMNVTYELVPYANIRYNFENVNCFDQTDTMFIFLQDCYGTYLDHAWYHYGCANYIGSYDKVPMGVTHYTYTVIRNGTLNTYNDTIKLVEGEYRDFLLQY